MRRLIAVAAIAMSTTTVTVSAVVVVKQNPQILERLFHSEQSIQQEYDDSDITGTFTQMPAAPQSTEEQQAVPGDPEAEDAVTDNGYFDDDGTTSDISIDDYASGIGNRGNFNEALAAAGNSQKSKKTEAKANAANTKNNTANADSAKLNAATGSTVENKKSVSPASEETGSTESTGSENNDNDYSGWGNSSRSTGSNGNSGSTNSAEGNSVTGREGGTGNTAETGKSSSVTGKSSNTGKSSSNIGKSSNTGKSSNAGKSNSCTGSSKSSGTGSSKSSKTKYAIRVMAGTGGSVRTSVTEAAAGETVTVTATPDDAYEFAGWTDQNGKVGGDLARPVKTFSMPAGPVSLTAAFSSKAAKRYTITVTAETGGSVTASVYEAAEGESVTVTATPVEDYHFYEFAGWADQNGNVGGDLSNAEKTFPMPAGNVALRARFSMKSTPRHAIRLPASIEHGSLTISGARTDDNGTPMALEGQVITLHSVPDTGHSQSSLSAVSNGNPVQLNRTDDGEYTFTVPGGDVDIAVAYTPMRWGIEYVTDGGVINSGEVTEYTYGVGATLPQNVTRQNTASYAYSFDGWFTEATGGTPVTVIGTTETGNKKFYAHWTQNARMYSITNHTDPNAPGTVGYVNVSAEAGAGSTVTMTIVREPGYETSTLSVTGNTSNSNIALSGSGDTRTFTMPTEPVTVSASFVQGLYSVRYISAETGSVISDKPDAHYGDTISLTVAPGTGYELTYLTVMGIITNQPVALSGTSNTRTFSMPAEPVRVDATFSARNWTVMLNEQGGTINGPTVTSYTYGIGATLPTDVTKQPTDTEQYSFLGWFTDAVDGSRVESIGTDDMGTKQFWAHWEASPRS